MERPTFKMHADKDKKRYPQNSGFQGWKSWMDKYLDGHIIRSQKSFKATLAARVMTDFFFFLTITDVKFICPFTV